MFLLQIIIIILERNSLLFQQVIRNPSFNPTLIPVLIHYPLKSTENPLDSDSKRREREKGEKSFSSRGETHRLEKEGDTWNLPRVTNNSSNIERRKNLLRDTRNNLPDDLSYHHIILYYIIIISYYIISYHQHSHPFFPLTLTHPLSLPSKDAELCLILIPVRSCTSPDLGESWRSLTTTNTLWVSEDLNQNFIRNQNIFGQFKYIFIANVVQAHWGTFSKSIKVHTRKFVRQSASEFVWWNPLSWVVISMKKLMSERLAGVHEILLLKTWYFKTWIPRFDFHDFKSYEKKLWKKEQKLWKNGTKIMKKWNKSYVGG